MNKILFRYFTLLALLFVLLSFEKSEPDLTNQHVSVIGVSPDSLSKDHLVYVFIPSCAKCKRFALQVQREYKNHKNIVGLTAEDFKGDIPYLRDSLYITFPILTTDKPRLRKYFYHVPRYVYVHDSMITTVSDTFLVGRL